MSGSNQVQGLAGAIDRLHHRGELPRPLPATHLTIARWFKDIVKDGELRPQKSKVFGEDILYLFYGGVFYRPLSGTTRKATELPIAFVFDPTILRSVSRYFPFDTGAVANGRYGDEWMKKLMSTKERFSLPGKGDPRVPSCMIYHLWKNNQKYLDGKANPKWKNGPVALRTLYDFFSDDPTSNGSDQRQSMIECQINSPLALNDKLRWVGCPECLTKELAKLFKCTWPSTPEIWEYHYHNNRNPVEIAAKLEQKAYDDIISSYLSRY